MNILRSIARSVLVRNHLINFATHISYITNTIARFHHGCVTAAHDVHLSAMEGRSFLPMFVNTGGQKAYLDKMCWQILAPDVDVSDWGEGKFLRGTVHGVACKLHYGQSQTEGVNMVGQDWLSGAKAMLIADYNVVGPASCNP